MNRIIIAIIVGSLLALILSPKDPTSPLALFSGYGILALSVLAIVGVVVYFIKRVRGNVLSDNGVEEHVDFNIVAHMRQRGESDSYLKRLSGGQDLLQRAYEDQAKEEGWGNLEKRATMAKGFQSVKHQEQGNSGNFLLGVATGMALTSDYDSNDHRSDNSLGNDSLNGNISNSSFDSGSYDNGDSY